PGSSCSILGPASGSRSITTGTAPSRAQERVIAAPIPFAPPVITIILFSSCRCTMCGSLSVKMGGVQAKDLLLVGDGQVLHVSGNELHHLRVAGRKQAYRPI